LALLIPAIISRKELRMGFGTSHLLVMEVKPLDWLSELEIKDKTYNSLYSGKLVGERNGGGGVGVFLPK